MYVIQGARRGPKELRHPPGTTAQVQEGLLWRFAPASRRVVRGTVGSRDTQSIRFVSYQHPSERQLHIRLVGALQRQGALKKKEKKAYVFHLLT
jgi:hypothetical protein